MTVPLGTEVLLEVGVERARQDFQWGEQNHDPFTYLAILGEEVGEANEAALTLRFAPRPGESSQARVRVDRERIAHLREELVQVAAVAVAMVECLDRGKWDW